MKFKRRVTEVFRVGRRRYKRLLAEEPKPTRMAVMDVDEVLEELGQFGRYQAVTYLLICLPVFFGAANSLSYVFVAGVPQYRCFVPGCDREENPLYNSTWTSLAIPKGEQCSMYTPLDNSSLSCPTNFSNSTQMCDRWVFDSEYTIVNEWNITCLENRWKLSLVGSMHFAGILIGSSIFGMLADRFGRKLIFIFCIILMSVTGIIQAVSPDYSTFQVFVFLNALGTAGVYPLAFILGVELVGPKRRDLSCLLLNYFYAFGEAAVALVAWIYKEWKSVQLAVSAPAGLFIIYYWWVPESIRWLLANHKTKDAAGIIKMAARINRVQLSERILNAFDENAQQQIVTADDAKKKDEKGILQSVWAILKSRKLSLRSLNIFFNWIANAFVYYGLSVNSAYMGGDKYINVALVSLVEIPGYTFAWLLMNRYGRRISLTGSMVICSVSCVGAAFIPPDNYWAMLILFLIGKVGITSSFAVVVVYTTELYPTVMRSVGFGVSSTVGRIGAIIAPFAPLLGEFIKPLPLILFGGISLLAGLLALFLPETLGKKLPDTVEEVDSF